MSGVTGTSTLDLTIKATAAARQLAACPGFVVIAFARCPKTEVIGKVTNIWAGATILGTLKLTGSSSRQEWDDQVQRLGISDTTKVHPVTAVYYRAEYRKGPRA